MSATQALHDEILNLEEGTWEAVKEGGGSLIPYLSQDCLMIFPGAPDIVSASSDPPLHEILTHQDIKPWTSYRMKDVAVINLGSGAASITYKVKAERDGNEYRAMMTTVWRNADGQWRIVLHQQTPELS